MTYLTIILSSIEYGSSKPTRKPSSSHPTSRPSFKSPTVSPTSSIPTMFVSSIPTISPSLYSPVPATIQRIFINIEDESPNRYFSANHYHNVQFLAEYVDRAVENGIQVGVFTTRQDWLGIMVDKVSHSPRSLSTRTDYYRYPTSNSSYVEYNPFYKLPLWLPKYDQQNNMVSSLPSPYSLSSSS